MEDGSFEINNVLLGEHDDLLLFGDCDDNMVLH